METIEPLLDPPSRPSKQLKILTPRNPIMEGDFALSQNNRKKKVMAESLASSSVAQLLDTARAPFMIETTRGNLIIVHSF